MLSDCWKAVIKHLNMFVLISLLVSSAFVHAHSLAIACRYCCLSVRKQSTVALLLQCMLYNTHTSLNRVSSLCRLHVKLRFAFVDRSRKALFSASQIYIFKPNLCIWFVRSASVTLHWAHRGLFGCSLLPKDTLTRRQPPEQLWPHIEGENGTESVQRPHSWAWVVAHIVVFKDLVRWFF